MVNGWTCINCGVHREGTALGCRSRVFVHSVMHAVDMQPQRRHSPCAPSCNGPVCCLTSPRSSALHTPPQFFLLNGALVASEEHLVRFWQKAFPAVRVPGERAKLLRRASVYAPPRPTPLHPVPPLPTLCPTPPDPAPCIPLHLAHPAPQPRLPPQRGTATC